MNKLLSIIAIILLLLIQQSSLAQVPTPNATNNTAIDFRQQTVIDVLAKLFPEHSIDNRSVKPLESIMLNITTKEKDKALILSVITTKLDIKAIFLSKHIIIYDN